MNKISKNKEDILIKKFNLKEARVNLTPCDEVGPNTLAQQSVDNQTYVASQQAVTDGVVYVSSDCINGEFVNIFCPSQEGGSIDQTSGLNLLISSELINTDGSIIVQQGEYLGSDCIFLPVTQDQTIQVLGNTELLSDSVEVPALVESTSSTTGFLLCSDPNSGISLTSEATLQNDVMLGQILAGTAKGSDDDDLVGELRNFLPKRNESASDIANDIPEYGMDWNAGELEWSLEQSAAVNEGAQTGEADKLNEEFSRRMREEFAASFINKNSLNELKKKIGSVKCPGKKEPEDGSKEKNSNEVEKKSKEEVVAVEPKERSDHKRKLVTASESLCKRLKKDASLGEHKLKTVSPKDKRKEQEMDKSKSKRIGADAEKKRETKGRTKNENCRGAKCRKCPQPGTVYCSHECIETHVQHSIQLLHGEQRVEKATERVVVLDRKTGKLITGPSAPTVSNLLSWIQKHPSFEVLQPKQVPKRISRRSSTTEENGNKSSKAHLGKTSSASSYCDKTKKKKKSEQPFPKAGLDSQRLSIRRSIQQMLLSKVTENVMMTTSEVKHLAIDLENELFASHKMVDAFYKQHYQGLLKLLKHASHEILNGEKSSDDFVKRALLEDDDILSMDGSTMKHDQHFYDINCQICNPSIAMDAKKTGRKSEEERPPPPLGKVLSPDVTSTTDVYVADSSSVTGIGDESPKPREEPRTDSCPTRVDDAGLELSSTTTTCPSREVVPEHLLDRVWYGCMNMKDSMTFKLSAFRTSGSMKLVRKNFPATLIIMGRIAEDVVVDYVRTIKTTFSSSKEVAVVCFSCEEETSEESYKNLFDYLHSRNRCGVVGPVGSTIKDVYLWPLPSSQPIPSFLTPFNGPGLDVNRGNLLLGIIVQHCSAAKESLTPSLLPNPVMESKSPEERNSCVEDDNEGNGDEKEYDIITGAVVPKNNLKSDCSQGYKNRGESSSPETRSSFSKNEDDQPYEPSDDCTTEEVENEVIAAGSEEIKKKFDSLLEILNKKPGLSASLTGTFVQEKPDGQPQNLQTSLNFTKLCNLGRESADKRSQISNCEAATAALASLNDFLEKFLIRKKQQQQSIEADDSATKNLLNFKFCEITNEQQQLMKQALEMVKAKSSNFSTASCLGADQSAYTVTVNGSRFAGTELSSPDSVKMENRFFRSSDDVQAVARNEMLFGQSPNPHPVADCKEVDRSWETYLSGSPAFGNRWRASTNFYQNRAGFNRGARLCNSQKRNYFPTCGGIREIVPCDNFFCRAPRFDGRRKADNFPRFHGYRRTYGNSGNTFGGCWRGPRR